MPSLMWFRRDLRLDDNPALNAAAERDGRVVPVFVIDPVLWEPAGPVRQTYLVNSLMSLNESLGGSLTILYGDPAIEIPTCAETLGTHEVHCASDFGPYGSRRDSAVSANLLQIKKTLVQTGSSYAVAPGRVLKGDGTPYRVYTPFYRGWLAHGWRGPAARVPMIFEKVPNGNVFPEPQECPVTLPQAGEDAALDRLDRFLATAVMTYDEDRNRADLAGTSALSHHLKYGEIHPRTILDRLGDSKGEEVFRKEIAWREFYADVLATAPTSSRDSLDPRFDTEMVWNSGDRSEEHFERWCAGRTGYPFVDAGMRQLLTEGWMHNRVRMVVASFLVKDLHLPWQRGAAHFMRWLRDGDIASNSHGWQWTAGCGTDASPFYRVFNPVLQGLKFDPNGDYVRTYIPELAHMKGNTVHEPWLHATMFDDAYAHGYPRPIVDHHRERDESLARHKALARD